MRVTVNGDQHDIQVQTTVEQLFERLRGDGCDKRGIAVAVNDEVIPRQSWPLQRLEDSDRILIITATQGG